MYRCEPILYKVLNDFLEKNYDNKWPCIRYLFSIKNLFFNSSEAQVIVSIIQRLLNFKVYSTCTHVFENQTKHDLRVPWTVRPFRRIKKNHPWLNSESVSGV